MIIQIIVLYLIDEVDHQLQEDKTKFRKKFYFNKKKYVYSLILTKVNNNTDTIYTIEYCISCCLISELNILKNKKRTIELNFYSCIGNDLIYYNFFNIRSIFLFVVDFGKEPVEAF
ncbi:hypothetical protein PPL_12029 [Heterostelium album PN500]|uniref:Uncharacterized protein n=1 Tax=Heterostelium pallidum (strain ATCC 26659 / Pp 5 / PN500) TaxID=670386 RepID=D3BV57_HETP5|nr:hypothetical protein PPL_12029 [Heterostelium album PN500]EFA74995.1 hypothetical protein PPL_12029 [Heterostelium album PN500]|eukprot:XP_020427129.1 hypothetical protein PPL_12029 [Heterostelium album PN500]